ncbi:sigma-54-dependent transcriptional regulator [Hydrogenophaga pseudoflava]|uniref:sigma-54-dependent transcriptional regulator n=1 Tax=Hydrogenophaga pseudoflava TaxID=47421 RepID=UPI0027E5A1AA|nr:sigma-54 dependent transcriptional regulator [Hydrogenophaga pseudoflava]MDQ7746373.1 sigma-54 dependent transcriptional regulator [Hydrogenophaga pseudoflava]
MTSILLIEDDPIMGESLMQRFELEGLQVSWCRRLSEARDALLSLPHAVVSDVRLPDGLATEWFVALPATVRALPWFFLTGYGSVNDAVAAVRAGAREYLTKPFDIESLVAKIREAVDLSVAPDDDALLGVSVAMRRVETMVHKVASQRVSVLLTGESGVGKEVAAQLIHSLDPRAGKGEFVAVNCAAIPETMMEAEFFGYEKGAFSGAVRTHKGYLERANKGTLFLDEVGELPASMQAKLLRALQEKCFFRLGAERTTQSDFRILAATNRDLYADMNAGAFREDLFYRLAVIKIELPPLRERPEDIRWLTEKLLAQIVLEQGRPLAMSEPFVRDLMGREWRGNVRELRSFLEEAVVLSDGGMLDLPEGQPAWSSAAVEASGNGIVTLQRVVETVERSHIQKALQHCEGSVGKTAEVLGISRKTLWEKMKKLAISA